MQNNSLDKINHLKIKNFVKKLCIVTRRYGKKEQISYDLKPPMETPDEKRLWAQLGQLEERVYKPYTQSNTMSIKNKDNIAELDTVLKSMEIKLNSLNAKKENREDTYKAD